jgi:hypothetical protein
MNDLLYYVTNHSGSLSFQEILFNLFAGVVAGGIIFLSYRFSHSGAVYSPKFNASLWMLTVVTSMVMCVIGNNVALSLGMVGALSIVRFRTAIKDARDTAYIFWCVAAGICCGISDFTIAVSGSAVLFLLMLAIGNSRANSRYLLIIRGAYSEEGSADVEAAMASLFGDGVRLCVKNRSLGCMEYIYELSTKQAELFRTKNGDSRIFAIAGTESVNLVGQNDEIAG